ncbi:hypothetical protein AVEN_206980-1 [Araneus ventricosus]|uniref:Uncharacterized protein n=1 Tax=Araneus ventricosus TaxID=182803 RepID=A0A4Y2LJK8_ARAVE|nr:hypothetical protein AVEN_206980-1 [Araneus ventricosus]
MKNDEGQATLDTISRRHKLSYEIKFVEIGKVVGTGDCQGFPEETMYSREVFLRFLSKVEGDGCKATFDDILRLHRLSYKIKIVEIGPVVGAGGLCQVFPEETMYSGEVFLLFRSEMEGGGCKATLCDIF